MLKKRKVHIATNKVSVLLLILLDQKKEEGMVRKLKNTWFLKTAAPNKYKNEYKSKIMKIRDTVFLVVVLELYRRGTLISSLQKSNDTWKSTTPC